MGSSRRGRDGSNDTGKGGEPEHGERGTRRMVGYTPAQISRECIGRLRKSRVDSSEIRPTLPKWKYTSCLDPTDRDCFS